MIARTLRSVVIPVALLAALGVPAAAAGQAATDGPSRLAVLTATSGTLGDGVLTLRGVGARTTWFLDRPRHQAGIDSTWSLIPAYFKTDAPAPNAAIEIAGRNGTTDTVIVELTRPVVNAARRTVRFAALVLPDAPDRMAAWRPRRLTTAPARFGRVSVFLDSWTQTCAGTLQLPSNVVAINPATSSDYGSDVNANANVWTPNGAVAAFEQVGGFADGCGGSVTYQLVQADDSGAPIQGGDLGMLRLSWGNPEIGSNSSSCLTDYPGVSCNVANVGGYNPIWNYVVG